MQRRSPSSLATLDIDATLVECCKAAALYCYKHFKAYQPLNVWWAEQGVVLHSEFRDGNLNAGLEQLRILHEAEAMLPETVTTVRMRSDTAGYQEELLRYCEMGTSERFGRIEFAVSADVTREFKRAVAEVPESEWTTIHRADSQGQRRPTSQQWAEVCFVPSSLSKSTKGTYRFLLNEAMKRLVLGGRFATARLKTIRFHLINLPGRVLSRARQVVVQVRANHPSFELLLAARQRILALAAASPP